MNTAVLFGVVDAYISEPTGIEEHIVEVCEAILQIRSAGGQLSNVYIDFLEVHEELYNRSQLENPLCENCGNDATVGDEEDQEGNVILTLCSNCAYH